MTKRMLVFLPCLAVALSFAGCGTDDGGGGQQILPIASLEGNPMILGPTSQATGSFSAPEDGNFPILNAAPVTGDLTPQSSQAFLYHPTHHRAMEGQIGGSFYGPTLAQMDERYSLNDRTAKLESDGSICLTAGKQTSYIRNVVAGGKTISVVEGANGCVTTTDRSTFPQVIEAPNGDLGVILVSGCLIPVEK